MIEIRQRATALGATALVLALLVVGLTVKPASAAPDQTFFPPGTPNGWRVYLSPAFHGSTPGVPSDNIGCFGYSENTGARQLAFLIKDHLISHGFTVRIGGDNAVTNRNRSNAWGAHFHVPLHSNAHTGAWNCNWDQPGYVSNGGSWMMYVSTQGHLLADHLLFFVGPQTPGPNDRTCTDLVCAGGQLTELRNTTAIAAYSETAFHTDGADTLTLAFSQANLASNLFAGIYYYIVNHHSAFARGQNEDFDPTRLPNPDELIGVIASRSLPNLPDAPPGPPDPSLNEVLPELRDTHLPFVEPDHSGRSR